MKKVIFLLAAAALLSASCSSEPIEDIALNSELQYRVESNFIDRSNARVAINLEEECFYSELLAGQTISVGSVTSSTVYDDYEMRTITYRTHGDWKIEEIHLDISTFENPNFPTTGSGNPKIGKFEINESFDEATNEVIIMFDLSSVPNRFSMAAHAVVIDGNKSETAWSEGTSFEGNSWATYSQVDLTTCAEYGELE